jgi:hypothetical protein
MVTPTERTDEKALLWEYVSLLDYAPPSASAKVISETWFAALHARLLPERQPEEDIFEEREDLKTLPQAQLEQVAPAPAWGAAAEALDARLQGWLANNETHLSPMFLIGAPFSGHAATLAAWAAQHGWRCIESPSVEAVLAGDSEWLSAQFGDGQPWVLPNLEKAYLRHADGLGVIRRFFAQLYAGKLGRGLVGCDSWGWAFLKNVWPDRLSAALALAPFDAAHLTRYLQHTTDTAGGQPPCQFRQSNNGKYVLPPPKANDNGDAPQQSDFLERLAVYSRGILGVAWAIWRESLRIEPEGDVAEETPGRTVWVAPWGEIKLPSIPGSAGHNHAFALHALLLHNGLDADTLQRVLPLAPGDVIEILYLLQSVKLLEQHEGVWRVTPQGYPAVRQFLADNGYPTDKF